MIKKIIMEIDNYCKDSNQSVTQEIIHRYASVYSTNHFEYALNFITLCRYYNIKY